MYCIYLPRSQKTRVVLSPCPPRSLYLFTSFTENKSCFIALPSSFIVSIYLVHRKQELFYRPALLVHCIYLPRSQKTRVVLSPCPPRSLYLFTSFTENKSCFIALPSSFIVSIYLVHRKQELFYRPALLVYCIYLPRSQKTRVVLSPCPPRVLYLFTSFTENKSCFIALPSSCIVYIYLVHRKQELFYRPALLVYCIYLPRSQKTRVVLSPCPPRVLYLFTSFTENKSCFIALPSSFIVSIYLVHRKQELFYRPALLVYCIYLPRSQKTRVVLSPCPPRVLYLFTSFTENKSCFIALPSSWHTYVSTPGFPYTRISPHLLPTAVSFCKGSYARVVGSKGRPYLIVCGRF